MKDIPAMSSKEQTDKLNEIFGSCEDHFYMNEVINLMPRAIRIGDRRGDLMVTHQDIAYFSVNDGMRIKVVLYVPIVGDMDFFDAAIEMLEKITSDPNVESCE